MEGLVRKGGNGLKVVTQAGFHRVRIPHDDLIKAKKRGRLFPRKVDLGHRLHRRIRPDAGPAIRSCRYLGGLMPRRRFHSPNRSPLHC